MKTFKKIIIVLVVLGLLAVGGVFAYLKFFDSTKSGKSSADFSMQATDLIHQLDSSKDAISKKYTDHVIAVTGTIKEMEEKQFNITINAGENAVVNCTVDSADFVKNQAVLKIGAPITLKGVYRDCDGFDKKAEPAADDDILGGLESEKKAILVKCFVEKK